MKFNRYLKIFTVPVKMVKSYLDPVKYAKSVGVQMNGNVSIYGSSYYMFSEPYLVSLGDNVHISIGVKFICHDGAVLPLRKRQPDLLIVQPISVGNNVFVGANAFISPGVSIGDNCIIGAHSVVTKDVPSGSVYAGNPACFIQTMEEYFTKAKDKSLNIVQPPLSKRRSIYLKILK